jgi:nucleoside-diphosphate-sugar epimerase
LTRQLEFGINVIEKTDQGLKVAITGVSGSVGSRVAERLVRDPAVETVLGIDRHAVRVKGAEIHEANLDTDDVTTPLEGSDVVVHLASAFDPSRDGLDSARMDADMARRVLKAASHAGARRLVIVSSAMVYGAWPDSPVPITEQAAVRPNPGFSFAVYKAEVERLAGQWKTDHPGSEVVILRPTTAVASGESSWVGRAMRAAALVNVGDGDPPVQFLHIDDLADAVALACVGDLDGPYNVAPDGLVSSEDVRSLSGKVPRVPLSEEQAGHFANVRWRSGLAPTPPGLVPYTVHSWVVANDRLKAAGWEPRHTNEEAYVSANAARPWAMMNSRRRQQLALGVTGAALAAAAAAGAVAVAHVRKRR